MIRYDIWYFKKLAIDNGGECLSNIYDNCRTKLEFKCSCGFIWKAEPRHIVEGRWCPKCGHQAGRLYDIDHEFFSRDTEESFYVAGFLAADGWKTRRSGGGFSIGLQLCAKDIDHLKSIKNVMKCTSPLRFRKRKGSKLVPTITFSYSFIANSERCYNDLERFGVVENKTYILRMSDWLCKHPLVHHFMRGYIDGDGCFYFSDNPGPHIAFSLGATKEFLEAFHGILLAAGICDENREIIANKGKKWLAFGKLLYGGNGIISKMYDFLYHDATIFLPRKEELARKAKELAVYGDGMCPKKKKKTALPITKEILLEKARELKSAKKIGKFFGCTGSNICWIVKSLGIRDEYDLAIENKLSGEYVYELYRELGTCAKVAEKLGLSKSRIGQIVKPFRVA